MGTLRDLLADSDVYRRNERVRYVLGNDQGEANDPEVGKNTEQNSLGT